ncbi:MAG: serine hydrolase, partial [Deltaproteobacteria bacterium]|nr:serine hydrolase [Deltaproteobacteria bacterium]
KTPGELEDITLVDPSLAWAGGAMISNLYDLKIWARELVEGSLLSKAIQTERLQWNNMVSCLGYGLGIMDWCGFIGHNGAILGYNNFVTYHPKRDVFVIVMSNKCNEDGKENPAQDLFVGIIKTLFPDLVPRKRK